MTDLCDTPDPEAVKAPFTLEQVAALEQWQVCAWVHPFTCPKEEHERTINLMPTPEGWVCPGRSCTYRQTWAWEFMFTLPPNPLAALDESTEAEQDSDFADPVLELAHYIVECFTDEEGFDPTDAVEVAEVLKGCDRILVSWDPDYEGPSEDVYDMAAATNALREEAENT
jgi:hypothetical protein